MSGGLIAAGTCGIGFSPSAITWAPVSTASVPGTASAAECVYPKPPANTPDGATATQDQMVEGMRAVKEYNGQVTAYLDCLEAEKNARIQAAGAHVLRDVRDPRLRPRQDAAHHRAAHRLAVGKHRLRLHEGRGGEHVGVLRHRLLHALPVLEPVVVGEDLQVRHHAEDPRSDFLLEAVHHRQHHDQRPDAERDADHRDRGIDADEAIAPARAGIAQADHELVSHGGQ